MPRSRAYRRHKKAVKIDRQLRIINAVLHWPGRWPDSRILNAHINCHCWEDPRERTLRRRRDERAWRRLEESAR